MRPIHIARVVVALYLCACRPADSAEEYVMPVDPHSFANTEVCRVRHLDLELTADFEARILSGAVTLDLEREPRTTQLVLDTDGLDILAVEGVKTERTGETAALPFTLGEHDPVRGRALSIELGAHDRRVRVRYATRPESAAVQWLTPEQTSGDQPFLFTQGQAILTRTWIPCQDTPGVRQTYSARIRCPAPLTAVMSAERVESDAPGTFAFRMRHAIPSYLIALGIGQLEFRALGPRSGVFAEPAVIEAAAYEFADTEKMMETAEALYGEYRWGRYDLLVLPPSFPFGGMENPCLTFATPTVIAGDRSLVGLVAHELAHSWSGNLVTNAEWADLWLNEGFTVYFENRIMEVLYGREHAAMLRALGWQDLQRGLEELGGDGPDTRLHVDVAGRNPDDAFSEVPYEKGALFLRAVEAAVGRPEMDRFLSDYFDRFAFQPMTARRFLDHLKADLFAERADLYDSLEIEEWVYGTGLPKSARAPAETAAFERTRHERERFLEGAAAGELDVTGWVTQQWIDFLRGLPSTLTPHQLDDLDRTFGLTATGNSEILFTWLKIAIAHNHQPAFPALENFLIRQGRRKFLKPLYQDLVKTDWGQSLANEIYTRARPGYHAVSRETIDDIINPKPSTNPPD